MALRRGHEAVYVTERAVFRLAADGVILCEVAPGIDLRRDVLDRMGFSPLIPREPEIMPAHYFSA